MDDLPMLFKADYEDDFVKMVYASEQETVGTYVPAWYADCCAELHDPIEEANPIPNPDPFFPRMTGAQLRWRFNQVEG